MNLAWPSYVIHGTNRPYGIGRRSSHGCIRMYPEDIEALFRIVQIGTPVRVIDTEYKLGWRQGRLFLEVTPTQTQADVIAQYKIPASLPVHGLYEAVRQQAGEHTHIDWQAVETAARERSGIPVIIGVRGD